MKQLRFQILLILFCTARLAVSLIVSDGKLRSDGLTYFGLTYNIIEHQTVTAILPAEESAIKAGMTADDLYRHFDAAQSPYRRLMNYQWLHSVLYAPFIMVWNSLSTIIILNNLLFFAAGFFLFRMAGKDLAAFSVAAGWCVYLFFPPFFYLTNNFYSEPLFIFLLAFIVNTIVLEKSRVPLLIIAAVLLPLTRSFGLLVLSGCVIIALANKEFRRGIILACCGILALIINGAVGANDRDAGMITADVPPPVIHSVYFSNTTNGNGDNDLYLEYPEKTTEDSLFASYTSGKISAAALLYELTLQNIRHPLKFLDNSYNKLTNYFFSIVPDDWIYRGMQPQSIYKKILWGVQNGGMIMLIFWSVHAWMPRYRKYYLAIFLISLAAHFIALSRYRYFQPMLMLGMPAIVASLDLVRAAIARRFPAANEHALPHP